MKILNTITAYPPSIGGAQIHQHILNQNLSQKYEIQVVSHWDTNRSDWLRGTTMTAPIHDKNYQLDGINIHRLGVSIPEKIRLFSHFFSYYFNIEFNANQIAKYLLKKLENQTEKYNLVHNIRVGREGLSLASYYYAKKYDLPFVFTPLHHPRWVGWRYQVYLDLYKKADALITLTEAEKTTLISLGVATEKITVTGIGAVLSPENNPQAFRDMAEIQEPFVLFLGQHYAYKGYAEILKATSLIWQKYPDLHFVFMGPTFTQSEKIFTEYIDPRIHCLGKVDLQTKTNALSACTILCVPSSQESFGGVYTEAWSFKKPVIACNIPAVSDVIVQDKDGILIEQNPVEIADAICQLLSNPDLANQMGEAGYQKVQNKYNWQIIAQKVDNLYCSLI